MSEYVLADKNDLSKIADALRSTSGSNETYTIPELSTAAVRSISSGGDGVTSWNDLTDRPCHKEEGEIYFIPETALTANPDMDGYMFYTEPIAKKMLIGATYTVIWNDVAYNSTAFDFNGGVVLGNIGAIGMGEDTGEPFIFMILSEKTKEEVGAEAACIPLDGSETATVSVYGPYKTYFPLDRGYLPADVPSVFVVNVVGNLSDDIPSNWTADKTNQETWNAFMAGQLVLFKFVPSGISCEYRAWAFECTNYYSIRFSYPDNSGVTRIYSYNTGNTFDRL